MNTISLLILFVAVGVSVAAIIVVSAIPMLTLAQEEQEDKAMGINGEEEAAAVSNPISDATEYIGIFVIGVSLGLLTAQSIAGRNTKTILGLMIHKKVFIFISIAALTMAAGIIHILLIKEHMEESYMWGIGFLVMGILQLIYAGVFIVFINNLERLEKRRAVVVLFYSIGIIGNILLVAIFIYARIFVPPFSPEGVPVNELEVNGILAVIIEIFITGLLVYLLQAEKEEKKPIISKQGK